MPEQHFIPSPCVRQCTLNTDDICIGCGRTLEEIKHWSLADIEEQKTIHKEADARLKIIRHR